VAHLVRYRTAEGHEADHEVSELADAIAYVERLRNEDGVEGARIYKIEELTFEFKPYFRVEIGDVKPAPAPAAAPVAAPAAEAEPAMAPVWAPPAETTAEAEGADRAPAHMAADTAVEMDPWADAPPAPSVDEAAVANGASRRGLFGR
jgi:hypothetical protein